MKTSVLLFLSLVLMSCEKIDVKPQFITNVRRSTCDNARLGTVEERTPYTTMVFHDEFEDTPSKSIFPSYAQSASCYSEKPACSKRLDWFGVSDSCDKEDYPHLSKLNKCIWNVWEGYNFWPSKKPFSAFNADQVKVYGDALHLSIQKVKLDKVNCGAQADKNDLSDDYFGTDCPVQVGGISSVPPGRNVRAYKGYDVKEGRVEMRVKINYVLNSWPALWLWESGAKSIWTELDIMEAGPNADAPGSVAPFQTVHTWTDKPKPGDHFSNGSTGTTNYSSGEWHTFGVERSGSMVKFYVDGCYTREIHDGDPDSKLNPHTTHINGTSPMFLIMGLGAGGSAMNDMEDGEFVIDSVTVYE